MHTTAMQEYPSLWKHYLELIYFDGKFPSKYIDQPRRVILHTCVVNSFTLGVVGLSVDLSQLGRI